MKDASTYHPVPAVRRFREHEAAKGHEAFSSHTNPHGHHLEQEHGPVQKTEVEKHEDGTAHVVAHHKDGHKEIHQHPNVAAAHAHARELMRGSGGAYAHERHGNEHEAEAQTAEEATPDAGLEDQDVMAGIGGEDEGAEAAGETECPNCGHQMQGGKCPNCGYEARAGNEGGEEEEEG